MEYKLYSYSSENSNKLVKPSESELYHHGVKGMRWGVRRTAKQLGYPTSKDKTKEKLKKIKEDPSKPNTSEQPKKGKLSELSDAELQAKINRMQLEQRYKDLMPKPIAQTKSHKGKQFVIGVIENSAKNVATQTVTFIMGKAVNKTLGKMLGDDNMINPKKGQKDK